MFERFTDRARRVIVLAQEEARLLRHDSIGTEHILLALLTEAEGVGARALDALGITLDAARRQVLVIVGEGTAPAQGHIPFTQPAKEVMELSLREALLMGHDFIGTEHLLLGLVREGESTGMQVLAALGAEPEAITQQVKGLLLESGPEGTWSRTASSSQDPPVGPLCPRCRAATAETAKTAAVRAPGPGGDLELVAVYCGMCGATYGLFPPHAGT